MIFNINSTRGHTGSLLVTTVVAGDGAANVCEVGGRCDRLCSDEC